ncbi:MAG: hypothetical protein MJB14_21945, partial [Spirochaetes bacterium]|nr:hypothetical protein [Spirochaetota bacterium]
SEKSTNSLKVLILSNDMSPPYGWLEPALFKYTLIISSLFDKIKILIKKNKNSKICDPTKPCLSNKIGLY